MKRTLIALVAVLSVSAVVAFGPLSDAPSSAQDPALLNASWFTEDGAVAAAIIAMALIAKRRNR